MLENGRTQLADVAASSSWLMSCTARSNKTISAEQIIAIIAVHAIPAENIQAQKIDTGQPQMPCGSMLWPIKVSHAFFVAKVVWSNCDIEWTRYGSNEACSCNWNRSNRCSDNEQKVGSTSEASLYLATKLMHRPQSFSPALPFELRAPRCDSKSKRKMEKLSRIEWHWMVNDDFAYAIPVGKLLWLLLNHLWQLMRHGPNWQPPTSAWQKIFQFFPRIRTQHVPRCGLIMTYNGMQSATGFAAYEWLLHLRQWPALSPCGSTSLLVPQWLPSFS